AAVHVDLHSFPTRRSSDLVGFFYWAGPRMFRESWFEMSIVNFGTLTAVASVGLMLLRAADPELKTDAARAYALRAPFFSPIAGRSEEHTSELQSRENLVCR